MLVNPTNSASAAQLRAEGTPHLAASHPQTPLPRAMPPCSTSKYIDNARARIQDGHIVCATRLKQPKIPIHAKPAVNNTRQSHSKGWTHPAAKVMPANSTVAPITKPSTEQLSLRRGKIAAPARAPRPKQGNRKP